MMIVRFGSGPVMHALFIVILPDITAARTIARLARGFRDERVIRRSPFPANRFHISLNGLGSSCGSPPRETIEQISAAASALCFPPFVVEFDHVLSWSEKARRHQLVLRGSQGLDGVEALHTRLEEQLVPYCPWYKRAKRFNPHLTLVYDEAIVEQRQIDPISWTVREFVLIESLQGLGRYIIHGRWPLTGGSETAGWGA